jgi:hypothetical protein
MNISPIVFFDMTAAIFILALGIVLIVYRLFKNTKTPLNIKEEISSGNIETPDEARTKAVKIIDDANSKALDIIANATLSRDLTLGVIKQEVSRVSSVQIEEFEKATSDFTKLYLQVLQNLKIKNIEVFQNLSKDIEINTMAEIKNFKESMQKLTTLSQQEVKEKIDADYATARKQIEDYEKEKLGKIDSKIYEILETTAKLVLGKAFSLSEHEELIIKSLEKAKKEGIFEE